MNRRRFFSAAGVVGAGLLLDRHLPRCQHATRLSLPMCGTGRGVSHRISTHPTPRAGITSAKVLTGAKLAKWPDLVQLFDGIRAIPAVADGIRCSCGCAEVPGFYSLLSCYEGDAMATICPICQGTGKLVVRLHGEGQTLAQIRVAVDAQFG